ncbi:hypothetical protein M433DRAFT_914 [Acidomyces richmondensis BFW]|nr:MAG: hypothetical protein FE78DRAFT_72041 [Acidomyces sp. 'richmondensis']KYG49698.1 hypothetical protein M433DRAFT_914 [Acidomyces richmondensis BFW]
MPSVQRQALSSPAPLLRLPLELRQQIYSYLLIKENVSHPFPSVGITSVSHRLPTSALLNIHPQLTDEILAYFYSVSTWKLIFSHAFNFFRIDPDLSHLARSSALKEIRNIEIVFFCDILLLRDYPSFGMSRFCDEIKHRAERACHVLTGARKLKRVTVSWIDTTMTGGWEQKAAVLQPLRRLAGGRDICFKIGEINGPDNLDRTAFVKAMRGVLGEEGQLDSGCDGTVNSEDEPSRMRMLAFDVRQNHQLAASESIFGGCRYCDGPQQQHTSIEEAHTGSVACTFS